MWYYYTASILPVWNWFLFIAVAFTGGPGVLHGGHWINKEERCLSGSGVERIWHTKEA